MERDANDVLPIGGWIVSRFKDMLAFVARDKSYLPAPCSHSARDEWNYKK